MVTYKLSDLDGSNESNGYILVRSDGSGGGNINPEDMIKIDNLMNEAIDKLLDGDTNGSANGEIQTIFEFSNNVFTGLH